MVPSSLLVNTAVLVPTGASNYHLCNQRKFLSKTQDRMVDILGSQSLDPIHSGALTLPPPEIAPISGSAPFLKMAQSSPPFDLVQICNRSLK